MNKFIIDNIIKIKKIENELELEQAVFVMNKLRLLQKENPGVKIVRRHLASLIEAYEATHWRETDKISEEQLKASNNAEVAMQFQARFIQKRKELIKSKLKSTGLLQNDLAAILGHRKNYMSELINGVRPFSQEDILIIHHILSIRLDDLIVPIIKAPTIERIRLVIQELNKPKKKIKLPEFNYSVA